VSRVYKAESSSTERNRLSRAIVLALRELMSQTEPDESSRDLAAFISLALAEIFKSIDSSVTAWEKRGYWVKADRFRRDWEWTQSCSEKIKTGVLTDNWAAIALSVAQVGEKLIKVKLAKNNRIGTPWIGAWKKLSGK
jgi:hypothetical protein